MKKDAFLVLRGVRQRLCCEVVQLIGVFPYAVTHVSLCSGTFFFITLPVLDTAVGVHTGSLLCFV